MNVAQVLVGWCLAALIFGLGCAYGSRKVAELREANRALGSFIAAQAGYIVELERTSATDDDAATAALAREFVEEGS